MSARRWRGPALTAAGAVITLVGVVGLLGDGDGDDADADGEAAATTTSTDVAEPTSTTSTTATTAPTTTTTLALEEAIPAFLARFDDAFGTGDPEAILVLLHPAVLDTFGVDTCRAYLAGPAGATPPGLTYREHAPPEDWLWEVDGRSVAVDLAVAVEVDRQISGQTIIQELHVAVVDGELRTFIDCTGA